MKFIIFNIAFNFIIFSCFSQNTGEFKVSFEFTKNSYAMERLNNFLLDTLYNGKSEGIFDTIPTNVIKNGNNFGVSILYKPLKFQSFGIYGGYQMGKIIRHTQFEGYPDFFGDTPMYNIDFTYYTQAFASGFVSQTFLDELFFDESSLFLQKTDLFVEVNAGIGLSIFKDKSLTKTTESGEVRIGQSQYYNYNSIDFHGRISMNFEYILTKSPLISSLGVKGGYQFLQTKNIRNDSGDYIINTNNQVKLNLDFSGFFVGAYLSIGIL